MVFFERFKRGPHGRYTSLSADESQSYTPVTPLPESWREKPKGLTWKRVASHVLISLLGVIIGLAWRDWPILFNHGYIRKAPFSKTHKVQRIQLTQNIDRTIGNHTPGLVRESYLRRQSNGRYPESMGRAGPEREGFRVSSTARVAAQSCRSVPPNSLSARAPHRLLYSCQRDTQAAA